MRNHTWPVIWVLYHWNVSSLVLKRSTVKDVTINQLKWSVHVVVTIYYRYAPMTSFLATHTLPLLAAWQYNVHQFKPIQLQHNVCIRQHEVPHQPDVGPPAIGPMSKWRLHDVWSDVSALQYFFICYCHLLDRRCWRQKLLILRVRWPISFIFLLASVW